MTINTIPGETVPSLFIQRHAALIRIWHWLTFVLLMGSVLTVLLNSTLLNQRKNIVVVQEQLKAKGVTVTEDQAFSVSRVYEDKIWDVHKLVGFGLVFLLLSRVVIELALPGEEKIRSRFSHVLGLYRQNNVQKPEYRHYLGVKSGYLLFYIILLIMALTGLGLAFGRELAFSREFHHTLKEVHSFGQFLIYAFIVIHLVGVIIADITKSKGLVSGMINGN